MSDDDVDTELLELWRQSLGISRPKPDEITSDTGVLRDAEYVYNNAIDVSIDMYGTKAAAASIYSVMQQRGYSTQTWSQHELHPKLSGGFSDVDVVKFVFTMDLLNFSFWSEKSEDQRYQVEYRGRRWTGYNSLVACLRRAIDEDIPITTPSFWNDPDCLDETIEGVFRGVTTEQMPLIGERIAMLREAGKILHKSFGDPDSDPEPEHEQRDAVNATSGEFAKVDNNGVVEGASDGTEEENSGPDNSQIVDTATGPDTTEATSSPFPKVEDVAAVVDSADAALLTKEDEGKETLISPVPTNEDRQLEIREPLETDLTVVRLIEKAGGSAGKLVNLLAKHFPSFRDEARFDGRRVRFLKRAQICVADLWAAFNGTSYGAFDDIDNLTMFADYRVPQMLRSLGVLVYSPPLEYAISSLKEIPPGHSWEVQLRGCSIWAVELIRREILNLHPEATGVNAVLIDFLLYDLTKEREAAAKQFDIRERICVSWGDANAAVKQGREQPHTTEQGRFGIELQPAWG